MQLIPNGNSLFCSSESFQGCLAAGCSAALRLWSHTCCLSSLDCLAMSCSTALCSCSHTHRLSKSNPSLTLSRFIGVDLPGEESSIAFSRSISVELDTSCQLAVNMKSCGHMCKFEMYMYLVFRSFNLIFSIYGHMQTHIHTYMCVLQCSPASVGLTQAHPNYMVYVHLHGKTHHCSAG